MGHLVKSVCFVRCTDAARADADAVLELGVPDQVMDGFFFRLTVLPPV
jgi:hypothetical protein